VSASLLLRDRLHHQHLLGEGLPSVGAVVRWFGAVQAQEVPGATWALARRVSTRLGEADVLAALDAGDIIRTHVLRPTWHVVAPEDLRWLLALTGPRVRAGQAARYTELGLDAATLSKAEQVFAHALGDVPHLTRHALGEQLGRAGVSTEGQRLPHLLMHAELDGLICSGPRQGRHFTYALVDQRVAPTATRSREDALAALMTRYFTSHGPATAHDAAWWSGLTIRDVREGVGLSGDALVADHIDGVPHWSGADGGTERPARDGRTRPHAPVVHLLSNFDEYTVAYRDRRALLHAGAEPSTVAQSALLSQPVMIDGRHGGRWRRTIPARASAPVTVEVQLLDAPAPAIQRALEAEVKRYAGFLARPVGLVTV
jgi:hypothetical protein